MTKRIFKSLPAVSLLALFMAAASPSQAAEVSADVPFSFTVNGATLPPGTYTVSTSGALGSVLVRGATGSAFAISNRLDTNGSDDCKLVFHKYGDTYILRQIWMGGGSTGRELPRPRLERELMEQKAASRTQQVNIAAK
jgi:hypothetical protein